MKARLRGEEGTTITWLLATLVMVMGVGGLSLDLWRAYSERRAVAGAVDAAAIAGTSGIDEQYLRSTGRVRLDPSRAIQLARANLDRHQPLFGTRVSVARDRTAVQVTARRRVPLVLLPLFVGAQELTITARAEARPRRSP